MFLIVVSAVALAVPLAFTFPNSARISSRTPYIYFSKGHSGENRGQEQLSKRFALMIILNA